MARHRCVFLFPVLFLLASCGNDTTTGSQTPSTATIAQTPVAFSSSDGFTLVGAWYTPAAPDSARPVVILLGMLNGSYTDWSPIVPDFIDGGYSVLAFDARGQGLSIFQNAQVVYASSFTEADFNLMPQDVVAAISWVGTQTNVDSTRIGVVGVDIGANVAFVSSGIDSRIKAAVSISPVFQEGQTVLTGTGLSDFHPHNILYLASYGDGNTSASAQAMAALTEGNKLVVGYYGTSHGYFILNFQDARNQVFGWLQNNL